jgi:hypothetical protein
MYRNFSAKVASLGALNAFPGADRQTLLHLWKVLEMEFN